jgi:hypothetical protein
VARAGAGDDLSEEGGHCWCVVVVVRVGWDRLLRDGCAAHVGSCGGRVMGDVLRRLDLTPVCLE